MTKAQNLQPKVFEADTSRLKFRRQPIKIWASTATVWGVGVDSPPPFAFGNLFELGHRTKCIL
jgi:hypothetical protein